MKYFSIGTILMIFNLVMANEFSLTRTGGGSNICSQSCNLTEVKKQAIANALEDGKTKIVNECEEKRKGIVTDITFPQDSEIECLSYETDGGEIISCKAEVTGDCDIS